MSYQYGNSLDAGTLARAEDVEAELVAIQTAFEALAGSGGQRTDGLTGVDFPFAVGRAVLPQHAIQFGHVQELLALVSGNSSGPLRGYSEYVTTLDASLSSNELDLTDANVFSLVMTGDQTLSLFVPATGYSHSCTLYVTSADLYNLTLAANIKWPNNASPTFSGDDVVVLHTLDDGATWYGAIVNFSAVTTNLGQLPDDYNATTIGSSPSLYWQMGEVNENNATDYSGNSNDGRYMANIDDTGRTVGVTEAMQGAVNIGHPSYFENVSSQKFLRTSIVTGTERGLLARRLAVKAGVPYNPFPTVQPYTTYYMDFPNSVALSDGSFACEMWFRQTYNEPSSTPQGGCGGLDSSGNPAFGIRVRGPSGPQFYIYDGGTRYSSGVAAALTFGTTYHLVGIFNVATQKVSLYANKTLLSEQTFSGLTFPTEVKELILGLEYQADGSIKDHIPAASLDPNLVNIQGSPQCANGLISQFAIYDGELSFADIVTHYNAGAGIVAHKASHWTLDEASGAAAVDSETIQDGQYLYDVTLNQTALINDAGKSILIATADDARSAFRVTYPAFDSDTEHSFSFWFKIPSGETIGDTDVFTVKSTDSSGNLTLRLQANGKLRLIYKSAVSDTEQTGESTSTISVDQDYFVTVVFDSARQAQLHVDGTLWLSTTTARTVWNFSTQFLLPGTLRAMDIIYDDAKLWNTAITVAQSLVEHDAYTL